MMKTLLTMITEKLRAATTSTSSQKKSFSKEFRATWTSSLPELGSCRFSGFDDVGGSCCE